MKRIGFIYGLLFCLVLSVAAQEKVVKLKIVETSDVHGNYYPYNFITRHEWKGSLARIYSFVQKEREQYKENLILLDNGDILQGQPTAYYYNYIDTVSPHLCSEMMNFMKYDAGNMGNHDLVIGLCHAGQEAFKMSGKYNENASLNVAKNVPGFDIVLMGHDHARECKKVMNVAGDSVLIIDPASNGIVLSNVDVTLKLKDGKVQSKEVKGELTETEAYGISEDFMKRFAPQYETVQKFVSKKIGTFTESISTHPAFFGPSAFIDLIHTLQLDITGADISFAAPLSFDAEIKKGDVFVSDMFNLYKYENMLYVMTLSGKEIKDFLEMSYYMWTNQMKSPEDHLLWFKKKPREGAEDRASFQNFSFNFDSASGIIYTVDVTKPKGEKITITSMADGSPFRMDKIYKDLRFYLMNYIEKKGTMNPKALNQWKFVPEKWTVPAAQRDSVYLFRSVQ